MENPGTGHEKGAQAPSYDELNPLSAMRGSLLKKAYLLPVAAILIATTTNPEFLTPVLALVLCSGGYYLVYQLCGRSKPWWLPLSAAAFTALLLVTPLWFGFEYLFRIVLPGNVPSPDKWSAIPFAALFPMVFIGVGLKEELAKAAVVFVCCYLGFKWKSPRRAEVGVFEPLDGILIAVAAAMGFAFFETMAQYVPNVMKEVVQKTGNESLAETVGLYVMARRLVGQVAGHAAYSGYFGYFIGLGILRPKYRWRLFGLGWLCAALLHALWDVYCDDAPTVALVIALLSYAALAAAILKARQISPSRSQNFATMLVSHWRPGVSPDLSHSLPHPQHHAKLTLVGLSGPISGRRFSLTDRELKLGRDPAQCHIVLPADVAKISRLHCVLRLNAGTATLEDCGSVNGTFLDSGERILPGQPRRLHINERFYLGSRSVMFQLTGEER